MLNTFYKRNSPKYVEMVSLVRKIQSFWHRIENKKKNKEVLLLFKLWQTFKLQFSEISSIFLNLADKLADFGQKLADT